ncbi:glutathione S-transferase family protein [Pleionea mediterranea]|uniref:Putative glutathione S-transferase n=1 Tax=Pleionea mediterranea TaxID=523701 RepID=A0A316FZP8_9GAMM|nr:glutathione S-transferase family protein [Pleionea mediterranea]PWK53862.1 putative glutathione S-transferase [Pleionea mediterranea]
MGLLVNGQWQDKWYDTDSTGGKFEREESGFRSWVTSDGSAGPSGDEGFKAEANRYHLYVSLACPWAHRTLIFRKLKGLEDLIDVSVVNPYMLEQGWSFKAFDGVVKDPIFNAEHMHQIYTAAKSDYTGRVTVPVLWDKKSNTIVSNESSEIIRMFNSAFDQVGAAEGDFYPEPLREKIDDINDFVYHNINNGVYKAGFATKQEVYEKAVSDLFNALEKIEGILAKNRYLTGDKITEADWRLFTTLVRFDAVYVGHFKCNIKRVFDYKHIWGYLKELYQMSGIKDTVNMTHIKTHYYASHDTINPTGIIPSGPAIPFEEPHGRYL